MTFKKWLLYRTTNLAILVLNLATFLSRQHQLFFIKSWGMIFKFDTFTVLFFLKTKLGIFRHIWPVFSISGTLSNFFPSFGIFVSLELATSRRLARCETIRGNAAIDLFTQLLLPSPTPTTQAGLGNNSNFWSFIKRPTSKKRSPGLKTDKGE